MKNKRFLAEYGALIALAILFLVNAITRGNTFLQVENLRNMVSQNSGNGIIAIGMTLVIIAGGIDLSVGSMAAMCGAVALLTINALSNGNAALAISAALLASVLVGLICGIVNGALVAYGRVAAFVVTLAGLAGFRSIALVLGSGGEIRSSLKAFGDFGFAGIPIPLTHDASGQPVLFYWSAVIFLLIAVVATVVLTRTRFGRYVIAVGANRKAAEYSGINTQMVRLAVFAILGVCTGIAALLVGSRMNSVGTGEFGAFYELDAIAAVVIGGTSLRGGKGRIWGTVVGIILLTLISNMLTAYHIDPNWQGLVRGTVILVAVLIQRGSKDDE